MVLVPLEYLRRETLSAERRPQTAGSFVQLRNVVVDEKKFPKVRILRDKVERNGAVLKVAAAQSAAARRSAQRAGEHAEHAGKHAGGRGGRAPDAFVTVELYYEGRARPAERTDIPARYVASASALAT